MQKKTLKQNTIVLEKYGSLLMPAKSSLKMKVVYNGYSVQFAAIDVARRRTHGLSTYQVFFNSTRNEGTSVIVGGHFRPKTESITLSTLISTKITVQVGTIYHYKISTFNKEHR